MWKTIGFASYILVVAVALVYQSYTSLKLAPVLTTNLGKIQGIVQKSRAGRDFLAYYGIPFAKPPTAQRRFEPPQAYGSWSQDVWDGTYHRKMCAQLEYLITGYFEGSEDCLYLNVFVPNPVESGNQDNSKLPVIVDIHGGYFHMGGSQLQGPHFFMDHDIIVVTLSYRLGVLGFLYTGHSLVRGNMGLKDQNLALHWVQDHIQSFGGDPTRVTLMGESAGAASVHYQMLSPRSSNLFWRTIRQSGSVLNFWTVKGQGESKEQAEAFARRVNCPVTTSQEMVTCLKNLEVKELLQGHRDLMVYPTPHRSKFVPTVETVLDDDAFLTAHPWELVKTGKFHRVPVLTGFNSDEGLLHSAAMYANHTLLNEAIDNWKTWAPLAFHYDPKRGDVTEKIFNFYFRPYHDLYREEFDWLRNLTNAIGDRRFNHGISKTVRFESEYLEETYNYVYDHQGGFRLNIIMESGQATIHPVLSIGWKVIKASLNHWLGLGLELSTVPGTCHGDELAMLWDSIPYRIFFDPQKDLGVSQAMVKLWVDFASGVKPLIFDGIQIPSKSTEGKLNFIRMSTNTEVIQNPIRERLEFWEGLNLQ